MHNLSEEKRKLLTQEKPLVIDGGLATHMEEHYGCDLHDPKWSTKILDTDPSIVENSHHDYFKAGAQAAITCTYRTNMDSYGHNYKLFKESIDQAVEVAKNAVDKASQETRLIIGSVGPYGQGQRDGSTFTGEYPSLDGLSVQEKEDAYVEFHKHRIMALNDHPDVDVIGAETIPRIDEGVALARHLCNANKKPFYISFVCRADGKSTGSGEAVGDIVAAMRPFFAHPLFWAFGINCTDACHISPLLDNINAELDKLPAGMRIPKRIIYPNSGEVFSFDTYTWTGHSEQQKDAFADMAERWVVKQGVSVIGGCCRINVKQIAQLREKLEKPIEAML